MAFPENFRLIRQQNVASSATADQDVAARIIYIGPTPTNNDTVGDVTLANWDPAVVYTASTTQTLMFYLDDGTTADSSIGTAGEVTIADADTFAEVAAVVNASANWRMVLVGAIDTDIFFTSTTYYVLAVTTTSANAKAADTNPGTALYFDTSVTTHSTLCLGPEAETATAFAPVCQRQSGETVVYKRDVTDVKDSDFAMHIAEQPTLFDSSTFFTTGSAKVQDAGAAATTLTIYAATQTSHRTLYTATGTSHASLASATTKTIASSDIGYDPLISEPGERILLRVNSNALALATVNVTGGYGYLQA